MKLKTIIFTISLAIISWCSFINENNIKENENIDVDDFIKEQSKTWITKIENTDTEAQKFEDEFDNLIDILFEVSN